MNSPEANAQSISGPSWRLLAQGTISVALGILALLWPDGGTHTLVVLFGLLTFMSGAAAILVALGEVGSRKSWEWPLMAGIVGALAGAVILKWPGIAAFAVLLLVGGWATTLGLAELTAAVANRDETATAWMSALLGTVSVLFGAVVLAWPTADLFALAYLLGVYALVRGMLSCALALPGQILTLQLPLPAQLSAEVSDEPARPAAVVAGGGA